MLGLLADANIEGQLIRLVEIVEAGPWKEIWDSLDVSVRTFEELRLMHDVSDAALWRTCQRQNLVLVTANRNQLGPDSLEAVIRSQNTLESLPVLTLADPERVMSDRRYARRVAERLLEYLFEIDRYRGSGRLFLP